MTRRIVDNLVLERGATPFLADKIAIYRAVFLLETPYHSRGHALWEVM
jgi:hypothetical protein